MKDSGWSEDNLVQQPDGSYSRMTDADVPPQKSAPPSKTKFRNVPVWRSDCTPIAKELLRLNDKKMASTKECRRYHELRYQEECGAISDLRCQVAFPVVDEVVWDPYDGTTPTVLSPIKYIADFTYLESVLNVYVVEDTKGMRTRLYLLKRHLFLVRYPQYIFREL